MTQEEIFKIARDAGFQTGEIHNQDGKPPRTFIKSLGENCTTELIRFVYLIENLAKKSNQLEFKFDNE